MKLKLLDRIQQHVKNRDKYTLMKGYSISSYFITSYRINYQQI